MNQPAVREWSRSKNPSSDNNEVYKHNFAPDVPLGPILAGVGYPLMWSGQRLNHWQTLPDTKPSALQGVAQTGVVGVLRL